MALVTKIKEYREQAGYKQSELAELVGAGIVIEKGFQPGGEELRKQNIRLESLAIVESMDEKTGTIVFRGDK